MTLAGRKEALGTGGCVCACVCVCEREKGDERRLPGWNENERYKKKESYTSETPRTWAFVRSTAESGGAPLARSIHTTSNPSASHAVPRPFRSPLTPYPPYSISNDPYYRRFRCSRPLSFSSTSLIARAPSRFFRATRERKNRLACTGVFFSWLFTAQIVQPGFVIAFAGCRTSSGLDELFWFRFRITRVEFRSGSLDWERGGMFGLDFSLGRLLKVFDRVGRVFRHWMRVNES